MEVLPILLLIILIIIVFNQNSKLVQQFQRLEAEMRLLRNQLLKFTEEKALLPKAMIPVLPAQEPVKETTAYKSLFTVVGDAEPAEPVKTIDESEILSTLRPVTVEPQPTEIIEAIQTGEPIAAPPKPTYKQPTPQPTFFERHPDMEKFIGENLINKIGIAILVLAIGFFVKYAIDQDWVGPIGRVAIGILCGGVLVALAHRMRNSYKSFSSVLAGGGLAVFYFTITLAYHQFNLFSQATAFIIMVVITLFAVLLALLYDKQELAVIALVGGFAAPFLVSDGSNNYKALFTYVIILNTGLLAIAYNKAWRLLNLLSFIFTVILFGSWLTLLKYNEAAVTFKNGFVFATIFYLLYFIINIAHNIKEKNRFIASDFGILLAGTSLYFAAGIYCLNKMDAAAFRGLFSASMGIFNLAATYFLFRKQKVDTNILYLLIGITLTFISITAPIQLQGNYITLFWASEAVLLYWLFTKAKIYIIQYASMLVWVLMLASLLMDWLKLYGFKNEAITIIVNKGFITTVFAAVSTYLLFLVKLKEADTEGMAPTNFIPNKNIFRITAIILLFAAGMLEINYQFDYYYPDTNINVLYLLLYTLSFISIFTFIAPRIKQAQLDWQRILVLFSGSIILYFLCEPQTFFIQKDMLIQQKNNVHFVAHWCSALLIGSLLYKLIKVCRNNKNMLADSFDCIAWVLCAVIVTYLSVEIALISNTAFYSATNPLDNIQRIYVKTGLPILWGVCSFIFMWLGMQYKYRTLRIISLSLFTLTLLKLFIFDIRNIPAGGKIAAFFCLGVLLLVVSFMYQRLKKIIIDNEAKVD